MKYTLDGKQYDTFANIVLENSLENSRLTTDSQGNLIYIKNNFGAVTIPTANNDETEGYSISSTWYDGSNKWICLDATTGAAKWSDSTVEADDLGTMAVQNADNVNITGGTITVPKVSTNIVESYGVGADVNLDINTKGAGKVNINANITKLNFDTTQTGTATEGELIWNDDCGTLSFGLPGGGSNEIGQEMEFRAKAKDVILDGQAVYISGSVGAVKEVNLVNSDNFNEACKTIAIATEDVALNQQGRFTTFGIVRGINTAAFEEGDVLYVGLNGNLTNVYPTVGNMVVYAGYCTRKHATEGEIFVSILISSGESITLVTQEPTGFYVPNNITVSYNATDRKVTLTGDVYAFYRCKRISELVSGYESIAHPATLDKSYFLVYNSTGFEWVDLSTETLSYSDLLIAYVYYGTTDKFALRECHGVMPWETHRHLHESTGTYKRSGGTIDDFTIDSTTEANRRPNISATNVMDEDLPTTNTLLNSKQYTVAHNSGNVVHFVTDNSDITLTNIANTQPFYNTFDGTNWGQTAMPANSVATVWIIAVPTTADTASQKYRYLFVQPQWITEASNQSAGQIDLAVSNELNRSVSELNLTNFNSLSPEYVPIGRVTIVYTSSNWYIRNAIRLTGSKNSLISAPSGNFLSVVNTDTTLTGNGTSSSPLGFFKLPNYTTSERNALTGLEDGVLIYNSTTKSVQVYSDSAWEDLQGYGS
jgi:hypothetical protein